jgi:recombination protein RecA
MKIEDALKSIEKRFGKEAICGNKVETKFVSTGSIGLDIACGGGIAEGRIVEYMGWESSGKTTLALHLAKEVQKLGKKVAYVDVEQAMDLDYAEAIGVDCDITKANPMFFLSQPDCGEDALEITREFAKVEEIGLIVIDSVAALVPKATIQGEAGDSKMGLLARMMSSMLPTLISNARKSGCIILFISQYREKIGVMFGDPTTTTGGNALKFYASQRLDIAKCGTEKEGEEIVANKTRVKVKKNKVAPPFKQANFNIEYGVGIDTVTEVIDLGVEFSVIKKAGSWFSYGETKLGQGVSGVKNILKDNPELYEELVLKIKANTGI